MCQSVNGEVVFFIVFVRQMFLFSHFWGDFGQLKHPKYSVKKTDFGQRPFVNRLAGAHGQRVYK